MKVYLWGGWKMRPVLYKLKGYSKVYFANISIWYGKWGSGLFGGGRGGA